MLLAALSMLSSAAPLRVADRDKTLPTPRALMLVSVVNTEGPTVGGWTWHHTEDIRPDGIGRMILVPEELHKAIDHTGGVAVYKDVVNFDAYPRS